MRGIAKLGPFLIHRFQKSDVKTVVKGKDDMINAAKVVTVDIVLSNSVICVLDGVIMPPA